MKAHFRKAQIAADEAAKIEATAAGPAPLESTDPLVDMINRQNALEMERFALEAAIMEALLKRHGSRVRVGEGGPILTQLFSPDWSATRRSHVLIVEEIGTE